MADPKVGRHYHSSALLLPAFFAYFSPFYHPWSDDDSQLITRWTESNRRYIQAMGKQAALAADSHLAGSLPLQPKLFLGLALFDCDLVSDARVAFRQALDDQFTSGWWLSDTLMADALEALGANIAKSDDAWVVTPGPVT